MTTELIQPPTKLGPKGLELVKQEEGFRASLYLDAVGVVTVGFGHAVKDPQTKLLLRGDEGMKRARSQFPNPLSVEKAESLLREDLEEFEKNVFDLTKACEFRLTQEMFDALVSFDYNTGSLGKSTLIKKIRAGDFVGAAQEFDKWVFGTVGGKKVKLKGLVRRRGREKALFLEGVTLLNR
jgi:lysozyme